MSRGSTRGPGKGPALKGYYFAATGRFEVRALAAFLLGLHGVPNDEPIWIDLTSARELDPVALVGLAHWVLRVRGHQVYVLGLGQVRGSQGSARRSRARA